MNPFRQPTENDQDLEERLQRDAEAMPPSCAPGEHHPAILHRTHRDGNDADVRNVCGVCGRQIERKSSEALWMTEPQTDAMEEGNELTIARREAHPPAI